MSCKPLFNVDSEKWMSETLHGLLSSMRYTINLFVPCACYISSLLQVVLRSVYYSSVVLHTL